MSQTVRLVAHLSDVHMLDRRSTRPAQQRIALHLLSYARALDSAARIVKLRRALALAKESGADHIVLSGDLTEVGSPAQFEVFAEVLADAAIDPARITLVPGNHDRYTSEHAWRSALAGPLRPYAEGAAEDAGKIVDRGDVVFVPLDVTRFQSLARSGGELTGAAFEALRATVVDHGRRNATLVVVQHHPPFGHGHFAWQWIDGLVGGAPMLELLAARPALSLLHGHRHAVIDRCLGDGRSRIFGAPAVVDDGDGAPRVRLYDVDPSEASWLHARDVSRSEAAPPQTEGRGRAVRRSASSSRRAPGAQR